MTKRDRCENEIRVHNTSAEAVIVSESDVGSIPDTGGETEFVGGDGESLSRSMSGGRISTGLSHALGAGTSVEVIIEVVDSGTLQVISDVVKSMIGSNGNVQSFGDTFPSPYLLAILDAVQVEEIARLEGVISIEENVNVSAISLGGMKPPIEPSVDLVDQGRTVRHPKRLEDES